MIGYAVPLTTYPAGYLDQKDQPLPYTAIAAQKNYFAVYLCVYQDKELEHWFKKAYKKSGKKLDMGKSCVRFKRLEDLPLDVIGQAIARISVKQFIAMYERGRKK